MKQEEYDVMNIKRSNNNQLSKWCPLINNKCKKTCVCFSEAFIADPTGEFFSAKCTNAMFSGEIKVNGNVHTY